MAVNCAPNLISSRRKEWIGRQAWGKERRVSVKMLGPFSIADLGVSSQNTEWGAVDRRGARFPSNGEQLGVKQV